MWRFYCYCNVFAFARGRQLSVSARGLLVCVRVMFGLLWTCEWPINALDKTRLREDLCYVLSSQLVKLTGLCCYGVDSPSREGRHDGTAAAVLRLGQQHWTSVEHRASQGLYNTASYLNCIANFTCSPRSRPNSTLIYLTTNCASCWKLNTCNNALMTK